MGDMVGYPRMPVLEQGFYSTADQPYEAFRCIDADSLCLGGGPESCGGDRSGHQCAFCEVGSDAMVDKPCKECGGGGFILYPLAMILLVCGLTVVFYIASGKKGGIFAQLPAMSTASQIFSLVQMIAVLGSFNVSYPPAAQALIDGMQVFVFDMTVLR